MNIDLNSQSYNKNSRKNSIILQISALIVVVAIIIFGLNYFKVINLSSLMQKKNIVQKSQPVPSSIRNSLPFLSCPLKSCGSAAIIKDASSSAYFLMFNNLASGAALLAATDGNFTKINSNTFTIENKQRGILVKYEIKSNSVKLNPNLATVADKQQIATLGNGQNSLTLSAIATITKQYLRLGLGTAGQYLTSQE